MQIFSILTSFALLLFDSTLAGNILIWAPVSSRSVKITFMPLAKELASKGHDVLLVYPHKSKHQTKRITELTINGSRFTELTEKTSSIAMTDGKNPSLLDVVDTMIETNDIALSDPEIVKLLKDPNTKFDVVIVLVIFNDVGVYLAHRFNSQLVIWNTGQVAMPWMDEALGQPNNPALMPHVLLHNIKHYKLTFLQRALNTAFLFFWHKLFRNWYVVGRFESLLRKHFPEEVRPTILELEKNAALGFSFGHPLIMDGLRPISPNFISIGMMNCRDPEPIADSLKSFMDAATDGLVYVSFGSVLNPTKMPEEKRQIFVNVFSRFPKVKFLWKWDTEEMEGQPSNVMLQKWLPQQDVLAHPNTKLFVTHSGQSSTQETICHKTPVIAIPVLGDQPANAKMAESVGYGISIPFKETTEENLFVAIKRVLEEPSFMERIQEFSDLLLNQIDKPLDRAVWMVENLIDSPNLGEFYRSPLHDLTWYQRENLDIYLFLTLLVIFPLALLYKCYFFFCR